MTDTELLDAFRLRVNEEVSDTLAGAYLSDAAALLKALTWRRELDEEMRSAQVRLAVILYSRRGTEGEKSRQEGDVSRTMDALPDDIRAQITAWRVART